MIDPVFSLLFLAAVLLPAVAIVWLLRRRRTGRGKAVAWAFIALPLALMLFYAGPDLFVSNEGMVTAYVLIPRSNATRFTDDLAAIARQHGLNPNQGKTTDDRDHSFYVLEANGHWLRLWATNMPMGGDENPAVCGRHREAYGDPGQYVVTLSRVLPFGTTEAAQVLMSSLGQELKGEGYEMRSTPVICSPLAKLMPNP